MTRLVSQPILTAPVGRHEAAAEAEAQPEGKKEQRRRTPALSTELAHVSVPAGRDAKIQIPRLPDIVLGQTEMVSNAAAAVATRHFVALSQHVRELFTNVTFPAWLAAYTDDPAGVKAFCDRESISMDRVKETINLAQQRFSGARAVTVGLSPDPEGGKTKLEVEVVLEGSVEAAFAAYNAFMSRWVASVPWEARKRICISYNVV